jgi:acetyl esterase
LTLVTRTDDSLAGRPRRRRAERLDPEAKALLDIINMAPLAPIRHANLARQRKAWRLVARTMGRNDTVARVETLHIPGPGGQIELKLYRPSATSEALPAFLWIHGGGFMMGDLTTSAAICRHVAQASGAVVAAVRYRLAPEHDLYAGREDCLAALRWLAAEGGSVGVDPTRLAIGGDSAGGNLAAAVAERYRQQGGAPLRLQVLVYPAANLRDDFPSKSENAAGFMLTSAGIDAIKVVLAERQPDLSDPWISPTFIPDKRGLPPALMILAGFDPIRDDGLAYAAQLREAGVPVDLLLYSGQFHGFINFNGVSRAARDALDRMSEALRLALNAPADSPVAADRTRELSASSRDTLPGLGLARETMLLGLMFGERLEAMRAAGLRRIFPGLGPLARANPLFYPVSACRAFIARELAPIDVREIRADNVNMLS